MSLSFHVPVLRDEIVHLLDIQPTDCVCDGTTGGGGHAQAFLDLNPAQLIAVDKDAQALAFAQQKVHVNNTVVHWVLDSFFNIKQIVKNLGLNSFDKCLVDLGVSSFQLDTPTRGFSFQHNGPLDMRMNLSQALTASVVINSYSMNDLVKIFINYGEEPHSRRIAAAIVAARQILPLQTTDDLATIIRQTVRHYAQQQKALMRIFQAVRIEVNQELEPLKRALEDLVDLLAPGGKLAVITFHSLEDRICKLAFNQLSTSCICPSQFPVCCCDHHATVIKVTRKPVIPSSVEVRSNSRAASAKLRVVQKVG